MVYEEQTMAVCGMCDPPIIGPNITQASFFGLVRPHQNGIASRFLSHLKVKLGIETFTAEVGVDTPRVVFWHPVNCGLLKKINV